jgi:predicted AAA+ superfamily ATPase
MPCGRHVVTTEFEEEESFYTENEESFLSNVSERKKTTEVSQIFNKISILLRVERERECVRGVSGHGEEMK